jgi:uncharacterized protein (DUF1919 family)
MATEPFAIEHTVQESPAIPQGLNFVEKTITFPIAAPRIQLRAELRHSVLSLRNRFGGALLRAGLQHRQFTVLSNDCWAEALYEGYGLPCQTPFSGAGMYADCFLRFLGDIDGYLRSPLGFIRETRYPALGRLRNQRATQNRPWLIALLGGDVEVHFLHSETEDEARRVWDLGCERLNLKRIAVKFSVDKDGATQEHIERFAALPFERKLLISRQSLPGIACALQTPDYVINGAVMFRRSLQYFDCTHWLNTGEIRCNTPRVWAGKAMFAWGV